MLRVQQSTHRERLLEWLRDTPWQIESLASSPASDTIGNASPGPVLSIRDCDDSKQQETCLENQLLWSFDRLSELLGDDDARVRRWAIERLTKLFPDETSRVLLDVIGDPDKLVRIYALDCIQNYGDAAAIGPIIAERMNLVDCDNFGMLADALASMGYQEGLPVVVEHLAEHNRSHRAITRDEFYGVMTALGIWGGEEARALLWSLLENMSKDSLSLPSVVDALLIGGMPEDASGLAALYRSQSSGPAAASFIKGFASSVGVSRLMDEVRRGLEKGLDDAIEHAGWRLGDPPASI